MCTRRAQYRYCPIDGGPDCQQYPTKKTQPKSSSIENTRYVPGMYLTRSRHQSKLPENSSASVCNVVSTTTNTHPNLHTTGRPPQQHNPHAAASNRQQLVAKYNDGQVLGCGIFAGVGCLDECQVCLFCTRYCLFHSNVERVEETR